MIDELISHGVETQEFKLERPTECSVAVERTSVADESYAFLDVSIKTAAVFCKVKGLRELVM